MQKFTAIYTLIALLASLNLGVSAPVLADEKLVLPATAVESIAGYEDVPVFGGSASVGGQVKSDHEGKATPYRFENLSHCIEPFYDFKAQMLEDHGLAFGADYNAVYQAASDSPGKDHAASGTARLFGTWALVGRDTVDVGSLVFKVESRHRLGTDVAPENLGSEIGYAGITADTFSDAGLLLTNLYWHQSLKQNRVALVAGIVDVTDYVDVYGLGNNKTDFINGAFNTNPAMPAPDQGLGAAARWRFANNYYLLAGLGDANGDPGDPLDSFDSFFGDHEYFKHIELGWFDSWQSRSTDNIHLTVWQVDERTAAEVDDGWGLAFSFSQKLDDRWLPFLRIGYSDGGGALLDRSVSTGIGYFRQDRADLLGLGLNWGRPSEEIFGTGLDDQYTAEVFYRMQLSRHVTVTPDLQLLVDPALNPEKSHIWIAGIRIRLNI